MPVYFDHNATTPIDARVLDAMLPFMRGAYGNASSAHSYGKAARTAIDIARDQIADCIDAHPSEILFTSGGTESNNWAIRTAVEQSAVQFKNADQNASAALVVSSIEHPAVMEAAKQMVAQQKSAQKSTATAKLEGSKNNNVDWRVEQWPVDQQGFAVPDYTVPADSQLVSMMWANNETGAVQPVTLAAEKAKQTGALFHTDAVQAIGKIPVSFRKSGAHLMTLAAHKMHGPKGIGALVVDRKAQISPMLFGGGHENGLRAGTENLPAIVGFGAAAELAKLELSERMNNAQQLRERLLVGLAELDLPVFSPSENTLPNTVQFAVPGMEGETALMLLDAQGFAVSSGSACATGKHEPSYVLTAQGIERELAIAAIRVSFGMSEHSPTKNTLAQVDAFLQKVSWLVQQTK